MLSSMPTGREHNPPKAIDLRIGEHLFAGVLGLANLAVGIGSLARDMPGVLVATLLISGCVMPVLAWFSYRRSRAAWAFLLTMCFVFAVTYTFGAPKIAHGLSIHLGIALIGPVLFAAAGIVLAGLYPDYATTEPVPS